MTPSSLIILREQYIGLINTVLRALEGWVWIDISGTGSSGGGVVVDNGSGDGNSGSGSSSWHFSSLFVLEATVFNMTVSFFVLFFWIMNRQLHLKPTKGSTVVRKHAADSSTDAENTASSSSSDTEHEDDGDDDDDGEDHGDYDYDAGDDEEEEEEEEEQQEGKHDDEDDGKFDAVAIATRKKQRQQRRRWMKRQRQRKEQQQQELDAKQQQIDNAKQQQQRRKPPKDLRRQSQVMQALLTSVIEDDDDDVSDDEDEALTTDDENYKQDDKTLLAAATTSSSSNATGKSSTSTVEDKRNLLRVLKKIKVFSYLNEEAQAICLEYLQYVDVSKGQKVCDNKHHPYDGSLYAVVQGSVDCLFHEYLLPVDDDSNDDEDGNDNNNNNSGGDGSDDDNNDTDNDRSNNNSKILAFSSGPGNIVTPLLAMLGGLVQHQKHNQQRQHNNDRSNYDDYLTAFTKGVSIVGSTNNTRLIRVPPECFSIILQKFPLEVHRIIHTVVCRVQRVSVQILVKTLGLGSELYGYHNYNNYRKKHNNNNHKPDNNEKSDNNQTTNGTITTNTTTITTTTTMDKGNKQQQQDQQEQQNQQRQQKKELLNHITSFLSSSNSNNNEESNPQHFDEIKAQAVQLAAMEIGAPTSSDSNNSSTIDLLSKHSNIMSVPGGHYLAQTGLHNDAVYLLLHGEVELGISIPTTTTATATTNHTSNNNNNNNNRKSRLATLRPGVLLGSLAAFSGEVSLFTVQCRRNSKNGCVFLKIPLPVFHELTQNHPNAMIKCLDRFLKLLSPVVHLLNWNSDWLQVKAAELIVHQYDPCDSLFLVLNGKIRAHYRNESNSNNSNNTGNDNHRSATTMTTGSNNNKAANHNNRRSFEEYGRGRCVGNIEGLTGNPWPFDIYAVRNSELVRVPMRILLAIIGMYPRSGLHLAKVIATRIQQQQQEQQNHNHQQQQQLNPGIGIGSSNRGIFSNNIASRALPLPSSSSPPALSSSSSSSSFFSPSIMPSYGLNLATIAVVSLSSSTTAADSLSNFCKTLASTCHQDIAPTKLMTKTIARHHLGGGGNNSVRRSRNKPMHDLKMTRLLGDIEENYRLTVYQADLKYTWWSRLCISQADLILVLVDADTEFETTTTSKNNKKKRITKINDTNKNPQSKHTFFKDNEQTKTKEKSTVKATTNKNNTAAAATTSTRNQIEQCLAWAYDSMHVRIEMVVLNNSSKSSKSTGNGSSIVSTICQKTSGIMPSKMIHDNNNNNNNKNNDADDNNDDDDHYYGYYDNETNCSDQLNNWFEEREWFIGQHTVREPFGKHELDFRRLCRRITGKSIGLALGGGGARGLAHIGIIKALMEAGITVDMVGGTSQGAFVGALFAKYPDNYEELKKASYKMAVGMASTKELLLDLTLPITSIFSGIRFNYNIRKQFKKLRIQDLILRFFCMSTDLQKRSQVVHTKGLLWKYVRASMSLTGYLPPVAENDSLLVDGGYTNLVPADVMRYNMGAKTVIAVDVSPESTAQYCNYGTGLSGWWLLYNSLNPFVKTVQVPSMTDLSDSLRWVSSDQHRKNIIQATDLHLLPPVGKYGTLDYGYFDEIVDIGYEYSKPIIDEWIKNNPHLVR